MQYRAYALLHCKAFDDDARVITGIATTPEPDRNGDIIDPLGVHVKNPIPLLLHHDKTLPVGFATFKRPTKDGIEFSAQLATVDEPGGLKDRLDEAWQSIKIGLISGVSIGFRAIEMAFLQSGGMHFLQSEVVELSLVTIPANAGASILTVKQLDTAALGLHAPGATGTVQVRPTMTNGEQIQTYETTRGARVARMQAIMTEAGAAGATLDAAHGEEYETLAREVANIDDHLTRLRTLEKTLGAAAVPIAPVRPTSTMTPTPHTIQVKANVPPGIPFVRAACALLQFKGNHHAAAEYARARWDATTPEVALYLRAAVAPGNTTDATWASPLVNEGIAADFIALLRPKTILGKIPGLRVVPFNTKVPAQTAGGSYGWVGQAKPKPVTKLALTSESLGIAKAAGIIVLTSELVKLSNPSAEALARDDMIQGIAGFLDAQLIDPAVAAVADVNPASITNGAPTAAATTDPVADFVALLQHFSTNNIPIAGVTVIMSEVNALALAFSRDAGGAKLFPNMTVNGGNIEGINIVTSQAAGTMMIALQPSLILYADDGGVTIDASQEATLQMDSAPASPPDATTVLVSLWQNNLVGLRAERFVNWKRANANAVKYLTAAAYTPA